MLTYDPRSISSRVYRQLSTLKSDTDQSAHKEQKSQAVELYIYIATWGLLRLKAEQTALKSQPNKHKQTVVKCFFQTLGAIAFPDSPDSLESEQGGLNYLTSIAASEYLGLTGLALQVAREFAFWAEAVYPDLQPRKVHLLKTHSFVYVNLVINWDIMTHTPRPWEMANKKSTEQSSRIYY